MVTFCRQFEQNEQLYGLFRKQRQLEGAEEESVIDDEALESHATSVIGVFDSAIQAIGQPEDFFELLQIYAQLHTAKAGFKPELLWV